MVEGIKMSLIPKTIPLTKQYRHFIHILKMEKQNYITSKCQRVKNLIHGIGRKKGIELHYRKL